MNAQNGGAQIKILYIDDDIDLINIYTRFFEDSDYLLNTAISAEQGFDVAKALVPDLIISDVLLPGMTGVDLCRLIRKEDTLRDAIVMLVTGMEVEPTDIIEGFNAGADEYLMKPFSREELFARIYALLRIKRLRDEVASLKTYCDSLQGESERLGRELEETRSFLSKDKELLNNSLKQVSMMVAERDERVKEISRLENRIENDRKALIKVLAQLIEAKVQYHRGHSPNVAEIATFIAGMMGLSEDEIGDIRAAALLHELGKLSIPDDLSLKYPADYSEAERDMMALHPVKAWDMLKEFEGMDRIGKIVRHIHECIDGKGYPDGLKKDRIPVGSKIIAAAGEFDNAAYRAGAVSTEDVLEAMEKEVGTRFDARVMTCLRKYAGRHNQQGEKKTIEVRLFEVKPGMTLAAGLYTAKGTKLLPENTILTKETINQIARYNKIDLLDETIFIKE